MSSSQCVNIIKCLSTHMMFPKNEILIFFSRYKNPGVGAKYCGTYIETKKKIIFCMCDTPREN